MSIFKGVATAIVTPFTHKGSVDYGALKQLINYQLNNDIDAIVLLGTTGESSTISYEERESLISFAKTVIKNTSKLIVGIGSNDTSVALKFLKQAERLGVDGCLAVTPYYNKCTQYGAFLYFKTLSENTHLPLIVYNVPSRTGFNLSVDTVMRLSTIKNIVGIKEANQDINHILDLFYKLNDKLDIYCGNDNLNSIFKNMGACGVISVTSNAYPQLVKKVWGGDEEINKLLYEVNNLLFVEPNPIPIKYLLSYLGFIKDALRPPLTSLSLRYRSLIKKQAIRLKEYV